RRGSADDGRWARWGSLVLLPGGGTRRAARGRCRFTSRAGTRRSRDDERPCSHLVRSAPVVYAAIRNTTEDSAKPSSEIVVPTSDQVLNVVIVSKPQNLPISQKPESFTCDQPIDAAPIAMTTAETAIPPKSPAMIAGAMIEAPVVAATVAEPCAMRRAIVTM